MYAVVFERTLLYLGEDQSLALETFRSNPKSSIHNIESIDKLKDIGVIESPEADKFIEQEFSDAIQRILTKLEEFGLSSDLPEKIQANSEKVIAEVRHIGIKGMKTVGEGFVALGDLLNKIAKEENGD
jgi:antitoxin component HigA of HigAB toxin-antitoxin module